MVVQPRRWCYAVAAGLPVTPLPTSSGGMWGDGGSTPRSPPLRRHHDAARRRRPSVGRPTVGACFSDHDVVGVRPLATRTGEGERRTAGGQAQQFRLGRVIVRRLVRLVHLCARDTENPPAAEPGGSICTWGIPRPRRQARRTPMMHTTPGRCQEDSAYFRRTLTSSQKFAVWDVTVRNRYGKRYTSRTLIPTFRDSRNVSKPVGVGGRRGPCHTTFVCWQSWSANSPFWLRWSTRRTATGQSYRQSLHLLRQSVDRLAGTCVCFHRFPMIP